MSLNLNVRVNNSYKSVLMEGNMNLLSYFVLLCWCLRNEVYVQLRPFIQEKPVISLPSEAVVSLPNEAV